ncbi:MAG TPA: type II toxin-antitoxin system prevent-host-death family antitoxin [Bryobacteraceae bacterium]|jgi:antitoxin (DNA-binding transcriptional repressor) of toxin-antitoxin stability system|nr:type II toxin-antitoxin system prevent-host-death family antitoxin [Bryobacteraceae bacterium]
MVVSVSEAKSKLTQLLAAVERGERVVIERHGHAIAEIVQPSAAIIPKFGTLKGVVHYDAETVRRSDASDDRRRDRRLSERALLIAGLFVLAGEGAEMLISPRAL